MTNEEKRNWLVKIKRQIGIDNKRNVSDQTLSQLQGALTMVNQNGDYQHGALLSGFIEFAFRTNSLSVDRFLSEK